MATSEKWRAFPGDFPVWQTVYTYFRNWRKDGTWLKIHDSLRQWTRIEIERHLSPSEAMIDSRQKQKYLDFYSLDNFLTMGGKLIVNSKFSRK